MCSDLVTDGADRDEPVGELIDGAKQRLSYVRHTLGHCSCIRKSRRERATAASVGASSQAATPCSVRTEARRGMSGASDERVRRGWSGVGFSICHQPPYVRHSPRGKARKLCQFLRLTPRCIYIALAVIPSPEIKIWCLNYQGEITRPSRTISRAFRMRSHYARSKNLQRHTAHAIQNRRGIRKRQVTHSTRRLSEAIAGHPLSWFGHRLRTTSRSSVT